MSLLFEQFLAATRVNEATDVLSNVSEQYNIAWRPVGGRENNLPTINIGSDPAANLIERVTNAIDAVLERTWFERGQPTGIVSPRSAVEQWFGIKEGKLENVKDLRDPSIQDLSNRVRVTLHGSERPDRPTVDIRDHGIGIEAQEFHSSILSLNESRKLKKFYLAGAFGQGGSTALLYSPYTFIISRAVRRNGNVPHPVACTVVRFNPGDYNVDKHGLYEYVVDHATGQPFTFDIPEERFPPGTLVRHLAMDLGKYNAILTAPTNSLWYLAHHYLFDPVLPYRIEERRENSSNGQNRTVAGNHRRLSYYRDKEYERSAVRNFREGTVTVKWWVLSTDGEQARNKINNFCLPSKPIAITYNGQKQGDLPNTIVKNDLGLPYLERYLIVHVDCDHLDNESRRQLFPTTRESLRENLLLEDLRRLVKETLEADPELERLNQERKQKYVQRVDTEAVENIRRRLARRVKTSLLTGGRGGAPRVEPPTPVDAPPPRVPIPAQEPPTFLEITNPSPRRVYGGRQFILRFKTDADPSYFMSPDAFIAIIDPPSFAQYTGTTNVRDGYGTAYFRASEEKEVGETAEITLELRPRGWKAITSSIAAQVVELPSDTGTDNGRTATPNITPHWVGDGEDFWLDRGWDDNSVAEVVQTDESVDIFVSSENKKLNKLLERAQRKDTKVVDTVRDFYLEHVSYHALLAHLGERKAVASIDTETTNMTASDLEQEQERELQRACETICGIAEQMFNFLATEGLVTTEADGE